MKIKYIFYCLSFPYILNLVFNSSSVDANTSNKSVLNNEEFFESILSNPNLTSEFITFFRLYNNESDSVIRKYKGKMNKKKRICHSAKGF